MDITRDLLISFSGVRIRIKRIWNYVQERVAGLTVNELLGKYENHQSFYCSNSMTQDVIRAHTMKEEKLTEYT